MIHAGKPTILDSRSVLSRLRARSAAAQCWLALASLAAGCSSRSGVLAVVGTRTITVHEFQEVARCDLRRKEGCSASQ